MTTRVFLCLLLFFPGVSWSCEPAELFQQVRSRLDLMPAVAAWKYQRGLPVEDLVRESRVLQRAGEDARTRGLVEEGVVSWVSAQVEMAKTLQTSAMRGWERGDAAVPTGGADLVNEIRPRLLKASAEQLELLVCLLRRGYTWSHADREVLSQNLADLPLDGEQVDALWQSLKRVELAPP